MKYRERLTLLHLGIFAVVRDFKSVASTASRFPRKVYAGAFSRRGGKSVRRAALKIRAEENRSRAISRLIIFAGGIIEPLGGCRRARR